MSLIEKILSFFKKKQPNLKDEGVNTDDHEVESVKVNPKPTRRKYPFKIKYTSTMINTITLSSDMNTLYLIDNGRAIEFPIDDKNGILIGTLNGQITIATALTAAEEEEEPDSPDTSGGRTKAAVTIPERIPLSFEKKQWTMVYRKKSRMMGIIGTSEIDFTFKGDGDNCESHVFNMKEKVIKIKKTKDGLEVSIINR